MSDVPTYSARDIGSLNHKTARKEKSIIGHLEIPIFF